MASRIVLEICTAYEQGFGHGYDKRDLTNPYVVGDGQEAWDYGYSEGLRQRSSDDRTREEVRGIERSRKTDDSSTDFMSARMSYAMGFMSAKEGRKDENPCLPKGGLDYAAWEAGNIDGREAFGVAQAKANRAQ